MRITQVILSKQLGGAERIAEDLSNELSRRHDVQVILRRPPRRFAGLSHGGNIASQLDPSITVHEVGRLLRNSKIAGLIKKFRPDVIHTHLGHAGRALRAIGPDAPLVASIMGEYKTHCYDTHDLLICLANWQRQKIPRDFSGRVTVIPPFVRDREMPLQADTVALRRELGISDDAIVVGALGRFSPEKGFGTLLKAFKQAELNERILVLLGDGPLRSELEAMAPPNVIFAGWQTDPWTYYQMFDIFVIPSRYEPFGVVVLEAMQAGVPIISTRSEGPVETLGQDAGLLVDVDDTAAMADALRQLAASPDLRQELAKNGRRRLETYTADAIVPRIEAEYRSLLT